jgi:hypothetical protein
MALYPTGNQAFDAAAAAADAALQLALAGVTDQAQSDAAFCNYFAAICAAGQASGIATPSAQVAYMNLIQPQTGQ